MNEVEGKILDIDAEAEIAKLLALGYATAGDETLVAKFYKNPEEETLRLRSEHGGWVLNHKKRNGDSGSRFKSMTETETFVSDPDATEAILLSIGFEKVRTVSKRRRSFVHAEREGKIEIDEYPDIPPLLEIEAESPEAVERIAGTLGFPKERLVADSIRDLEKRYGVQFGK